jgi:hypothetical protein
MSHYTPKAQSGARLPHGVTGDGRSLLDFVPYAPDGFRLLHHANANFSSCSWAVDTVTLGLPETWYDVVPAARGGKGIVVRPDQHVLELVNSVAEADNVVKEYLATGKA